MAPTRLILALCLLASAPVAQEIERSFPAQTFTLDPAHTSVLFSVNHIGFSHYTAGFDTVIGTLTLDPDHPEAAQLDVTIPLASLDLPNPTADFAQMLLGPFWLDSAAHPDMTYHSTAIRLTGGHSASVTGDLSLRGVSHPVTLEVTFNGGWGRQPFEPHARIGFSAQGVLRRSDFGMSEGLPPPGSDFGVGDEISIRIETELTGEPFR